MRPARWPCLLLVAGSSACFDVNMPPPAALGAPMAPQVVEQAGWGVGLQEQVHGGAPFNTAVDLERALPLGDSPWSLGFGGLVSARYASIEPALGWRSPTLGPAQRWQLGGRLGLTFGSGSLVGRRFLDPFAGGSVLAQAAWSWGWGGVGALGGAVGYGVVGYLTCPAGCDVEREVDGVVDSVELMPFRSPIFQLHADMPMSEDQPVALRLSCGLYPLELKGGTELLWSLGLGVQWWPQDEAAPPK